VSPPSRALHAPPRYRVPAPSLVIKNFDLGFLSLSSPLLFPGLLSPSIKMTFVSFCVLGVAFLPFPPSKPFYLFRRAKRVSPSRAEIHAVFVSDLCLSRGRDFVTEDIVESGVFFGFSPLLFF